MNNQLYPQDNLDALSSQISLPISVDCNWLDTKFANMAEQLAEMENVIRTLEQRLADTDPSLPEAKERQFFSVQEFAALVDRSEYTVREWCRYVRINAEKCESGRGDAKSWKIPAEELARYRDHGLLTGQ